MEISKKERSTDQKPYSLSRSVGISNVHMYLQLTVSVEAFLIDRLLLEHDLSDLFHRPTLE